jgi:CheY-like chemotaxis protein
MGDPPDAAISNAGKSMTKFNQYRAFDMNALVICQDNVFLPTMNRVLSRLGLQTDVTADFDSVRSLIEKKKLDAIVIDWQEIAGFGELFEQIRNSRRNHDAVQVAIARDLMDIRQAFSSGVQFLVHKPASVVQISGCLEAMRGAVLRQRRRDHREPVRVAAELTVRGSQLMGAMIVNVANDGLGLLLNGRTCKASAELSAGSDVDFAFVLPETSQLIVGSGIIKWIDRDGRAAIEFLSATSAPQRPASNAGLQFQCMSDMHKESVEQWVGERFDRQIARLYASQKEDARKQGCA